MLSERFIFAALAVIVVAVFLLVSAVPQDPQYLAFADTRSMFGIPNFWNVASNLPFLLVGAWGVAVTRRLRASDESISLQHMYFVFFTGMLVTAFGSSWFHLAPSNESLAWDRLTMTIAFAGLFPAVIGEFVSREAARKVLLIMLLAGPGSVAYWIWTESQGAGDLRAYAIVQFLPMLAIAGILISSKTKPETRRAFAWLVAFYLAAKVFETFDARMLDWTGLFSGHSLKHIIAALSSVPVILVLDRRTAGGTTT